MTSSSINATSPKFVGIPQSLTHFVEEWQKAATCNAVSGVEPLPCTFIPEEPGSYRISATIQDTKGKEHSTQIFAWVAGKGWVLWSRKKDDNSLQIIPESGSYQIGDTARYLIKNPFPGATALVSVERYGVLKHWVQTLGGSTPVIEFPIEPDFLPGFYLSVLVVSPRVASPRVATPPMATPLSIGQVDLGKPAFRMGYVQVPVKDPYKEVLVDVVVAQDNYKPRDTVNVSLQARLRRPGKKEPIELAITVLDEAVFDLLAAGKNTFDPYAGFYRLDGLDLKNFNLLMRLVGRQKFEKKGADPGGDGGPGRSLRSLFKFVSYWNPSVIVDETDQADFSFDAPDNLTGWRVLVMAVTPTDRMGLGEGSFSVNRPTEVRPVMPNQVRAGDHFAAGFSVMNRTDQPREITVTIKAEGDVVADKMQAAHIETVRLAPYKRTTVWMEVYTSWVYTASVQAEGETSQGAVNFTVTAGDDFDQDGLVYQLPVYQRRSFETAATYGSTTKAQVQTAIEFPKNMHTDVGALSVTAAPTVIGNVEGAFSYMRDYPYVCWEQVLSKGVMAAQYLNLRAYMPPDFVWPDSQELPQQTLDQAANYQAPNGGMTYFVPQDRCASPYLSAYTALAFNWLRTSGYDVPQPVEQKLHAYLKSYLKRDIAPSFYSKGMSSTVHAVALAALAEHQQVTAQDVERYRPHLPFMSLFGKAHYLQALLKIGGQAGQTRQDQQIDEVLGLILSHANESGGKIGFNEVLDDGYARILATPLRTNCAILSMLTLAATDANRATQIGDLPFKLVRTITQARGNRDHWENTQENLFCLNALTDYRRQYEQTAPQLTIRARVDTDLLGEGRFSDFRDEPLLFERAVSAGDPGRKATVSIEREGTGRVYYETRLRYAPLPKDAARINAGMDIRREYSVERDGQWVLLEQPFRIKRGELVRVDLYLSVPTARHFVVVDDAVPGGLEPVNRDLATTSSLDADKGQFQAAGSSWWFRYPDWLVFQVSRWSFYHQELRHDSARFYADYLEAGNYHLSYTAQAIASGIFAAPPVYVEEMYDPDVFGKGLPGTLQVEQIEQVEHAPLQ